MYNNEVLKEKLVFTQIPGNIVSEMDGEKVMLNIQQGKYYNLGTLGGEIWDLLINPLSLDELVSSLLSTYIVEKSTCEEQVMTFLNELSKEGLILKEKK